MIELHNLSGTPFVLNEDAIERFCPSATGTDILLRTTDDEGRTDILRVSESYAQVASLLLVNTDALNTERLDAALRILNQITDYTVRATDLLNGEYLAAEDAARTPDERKAIALKSIGNVRRAALNAMDEIHKYLDGDFSKTKNS